MKNSAQLVLLLVGLFLALEFMFPMETQASVFPERRENAVATVAKSTLWGAVGGSLVGLAVLLVVNESDSSEDIFRWSFVAGTALGFGYGIYYVASTPKEPQAAFHFEGIKLARVCMPKPNLHVSTRGDVSVHVNLLTVGF